MGTYRRNKPRHRRGADGVTLPLFPFFAQLRAAMAPAAAPVLRRRRNKRPPPMQLLWLWPEFAPKPKPRPKRYRPDPILKVRREFKKAGEHGVPREAAGAPVSVFSLAGSKFKLRAKTVAKARRHAARVQPVEGGLRVGGAAYPVRWTAQDEERERERRARQRPPKPGKGARTKGAKLRGLLGEGE